MFESKFSRGDSMNFFTGPFSTAKLLVDDMLLKLSRFAALSSKWLRALFIWMYYYSKFFAFLDVRWLWLFVFSAPKALVEFRRTVDTNEDETLAVGWLDFLFVI